VGLYWKRHITQFGRLVPHVRVDDAVEVVHPDQEPIPHRDDLVGPPAGNFPPLALVVDDRQPLELPLPVAGGSKQAQLCLQGIVPVLSITIQRCQNHLALAAAEETDPICIHVALLFPPWMILFGEVARRQRRERRRPGWLCRCVACAVEEVVVVVIVPRAGRVTLLTSSLPYLSKSSGQWLPNKEGEREKEKKKRG
jgi:hypothetical protein